MSIPNIPNRTHTMSTEELRQRLAGLIDPQEFHGMAPEQLKTVAVQFCSALPSVFGDSLDRVTMWDKIAAAIQSGYAKTISGDTDLFTQHVLESIQADPAKAIASDRLTSAIDALQSMGDQERIDWMQYLVSHLIPILVHARRDHKSRLVADAGVVIAGEA